jgi:siderophore synthetase component
MNISAADALSAEVLLRCWVRESRIPVPTGGPMRLTFPATGVTVEVDVDAWSAVGWHRFGPAYPVSLPVFSRKAGTPKNKSLGRPDGDEIGEDSAWNASSWMPPVPAPPLDAATIAALIAREAGGGAHAVADLVARVIDSSHRIAVHLTNGTTQGGTRFLWAEKALVAGHPFHPAPKAREGLSDAEAARYSPELEGSFQLHWWAVDPSIASHDSADADPAPTIVGKLLGADRPAGLRPDTILIPAHPWQSRDLHTRPEIAELVERGLLADLGPHGKPWHATSSIRTVYRPDVPYMLKLPLALRITNSKRENLRKELLRGVEVRRMLDAGLAKAIHKEHPGFGIVGDPAWIAAETGGVGLDAILRENPFGPMDRMYCVAAFADLGYGPSRTGHLRENLLADIIVGSADRTGARPSDAVLAWFTRYLEAVVLPLLWLDAEHGITLEAHQQNTLVALDPTGLPEGGRYRDNQGYYFRESALGHLAEFVDHPGEASDSIVPDAVVDERLIYYVGVNNLLGMIGACGATGLADERLLLRRAREVLTRFATARRGAGRPHAPTETMLDAPTLRCKANLLTRVAGLDELVGPLETQSVYVPIPNPLAVP